jgi:hypothetical protein
MPARELALGAYVFGLFGKTDRTPPPARKPLSQPLPWRTDASLPIPEWDELAPPRTADHSKLHQFWDTAAFTWLVALGARLGKQYSIAESDEFMLLGALAERQKELALEYAEKTRRRILSVLQGIAADEGYGKCVMLVVHDQDTYYNYITNYYGDVPDTQELSFSSGVYINRGYGHFVFVADDLDRIEPVIAHELTHSLMAHLPLPAWVNEGIAVNTERRLWPRSRSPFTALELEEKFAKFWNASTIQEFWSGKSWLRPDEGNSLSYELATTFIGLIARDWSSFAAFVNAADIADGAEAAAQRHLGYSVAHLAEAVLGPGDWAPDPERWKEGVEHGQF